MNRVMYSRLSNESNVLGLLSSINLPQCTYPSDAFDGDLIDSGKLSKSVHFEENA